MKAESPSIAPGTVFGKLTVLDEPRVKRSGRHWYCTCKCNCHRASVVVVRQSSLKSGHTVSCGCARIEAVRDARITHWHCIGEGHSPEYSAWTGARQSASDPRHAAWPWIGGLGIKMAAKWLYDFPAFYAEVGPKPTTEHRLGRKDHKRGYMPGNVEWQSREEWYPHRADNRFFKVGRTTLCMADWAKKVRINKSTLHYRLSKGLTMKEAIARGHGGRGKNGKALV